VVVLAVIASALVVLFGLVTVVWAAVQFIYFAGPVGDQGTFAVLGSSTCNFSSDADHTCSQAEYAGGSINATSTGSLTATRKMILPLNPGEAKDVFNATTGGQSITVGGSTGTPTTAIPNGTQARVVTPDGVNYYAISGGGGGFDAATYTGQPGFFYWDAGSLVWRQITATDLPPNVSFATVDAGGYLGDAAVFNTVTANYWALTTDGGEFGRGRIEFRGSFSDTTSWVTVYPPFAPDLGAQPDCYLMIEAHDWSGFPDGGVAISDGAAGAADGTVPVANFSKFNLEGHVEQLAFLADGAAGTQLFCTSQAGNPGAQDASCTLAPGSVSSVSGCSTSNSTLGCTGSSSTPFTAQLLIDGGSYMFQVRPETLASDGGVISQITTLPWRWRATLDCAPRAQ